MKKTISLLAISAALATTMTSCLGWTTTATVDGGTGWYAGDYAPYYWSDWNGISAPPIFGNGPGSISPGYYPRPLPPQYRPGNMRPGNGSNRPNSPGIGNPGNNPLLPGNNTKPAAPPSVGNGPGSNPGSPQQGGFRGDK